MLLNLAFRCSVSGTDMPMSLEAVRSLGQFRQERNSSQAHLAVGQMIDELAGAQGRPVDASASNGWTWAGGWSRSAWPAAGTPWAASRTWTRRW